MPRSAQWMSSNTRTSDSGGSTASTTASSCSSTCSVGSPETAEAWPSAPSAARLAAQELDQRRVAQGLVAERDTTAHEDRRARGARLGRELGDQSGLAAARVAAQEEATGAARTRHAR